MLVDGKRVEVIEHHHLARMASTREATPPESRRPPLSSGCGPRLYLGKAAAYYSRAAR